MIGIREHWSIQYIFSDISNVVVIIVWNDENLFEIMHSYLPSPSNDILFTALEWVNTQDNLVRHEIRLLDRCYTVDSFEFLLIMAVGRLGDSALSEPLVAYTQVPNFMWPTWVHKFAIWIRCVKS